MKKEYEKPYINTIEIKGNENIADGTSSLAENGIQTASTYGVISYNALKY
ncbi:MAG: hypothetical protein LIO44_04575 [Eubacterium sp.]|nr:hypothetical protein [Eubacterium sp.]